MDTVESSFSIWHWLVSVRVGTENSQRWLIWNSYATVTVFRRDGTNITRKKRRTKESLKLIRCEDTKVVLVVINFSEVNCPR